MQLLDRMTQSRRREVEFLNVVSDLTSELELGAPARPGHGRGDADARRRASTLFLNDEKTGELFSYIGDQLDDRDPVPEHVGIAGVGVHDRRVDPDPARLRRPALQPRLRPADRLLHALDPLRPRSSTRQGKAIGVTQALNKRGGPFTAEDESRLRAFTAQIASGLENAKLFADVQAMKNYNEAMLESMSNGVVTFDDEGIAQTCNAAGARILRREEADVIGTSSHDLLRRRQRVAARADEAGRRRRSRLS